VSGAGTDPVRAVIRHPGRYVDSISLLALGGTLLDVPGVLRAAAAMGTPDGRERLVEAGFDASEVPVAGATDLLVAVEATDALTMEAALGLVVATLDRPARRTSGPRPGDPGRGGPDSDGSGPSERCASVRQFLRRGGQAGLAVVAVPGVHAEAVAARTLRAGMHTLIFSDNVDVAAEVRLKDLARNVGVLAMGPDCGTAILDGVPLGFANAVRPGPVGVVGASGTGMQEVTSRVHRLGSGISQAVGCGGRDLSDVVGGSTMVRGIALVAADPATEVVVVVSKPASPAVLDRVAAAARQVIAGGVPVVAAVVGAGSEAFAGTGVHVVPTLAAAADLAVTLTRRGPADGGVDVGLAEGPDVGPDGGTTGPAAVDVPAPVPGGARTGRIHGAFCGGTFAAEAAALLDRAGLGDRAELVDFGDDRFTRGRPHPMIDPRLRDGHVAEVRVRPDTAVVIVDVVLGHGAAADPVAGLVAVLSRPDAGMGAPVVAHVCGTDDDPQCRRDVVDRLRLVPGLIVEDSNAAAVARAVGLAGGSPEPPEREGRGPGGGA
jgi:FdrA protein